MFYLYGYTLLQRVNEKVDTMRKRRTFNTGYRIITKKLSLFLSCYYFFKFSLPTRTLHFLFVRHQPHDRNDFKKMMNELKWL